MWAGLDYLGGSEAIQLVNSAAASERQTILTALRSSINKALSEGIGSSLRCEEWTVRNICVAMEAALEYQLHPPLFSFAAPSLWLALAQLRQIQQRSATKPAEPSAGWVLLQAAGEAVALARGLAEKQLSTLLEPREAREVNGGVTDAYAARLWLCLALTRRVLHEWLIALSRALPQFYAEVALVRRHEDFQLLLDLVHPLQHLSFHLLEKPPPNLGAFLALPDVISSKEGPSSATQAPPLASPPPTTEVEDKVVSSRCNAHVDATSAHSEGGSENEGSSAARMPAHARPRASRKKPPTSAEILDANLSRPVVGRQAVRPRATRCAIPAMSSPLRPKSARNPARSVARQAQSAADHSQSALPLSESAAQTSQSVPLPAQSELLPPQTAAPHSQIEPEQESSSCIRGRNSTAEGTDHTSENEEDRRESLFGRFTTFLDTKMAFLDKVATRATVRQDEDPPPEHEAETSTVNANGDFTKEYLDKFTSIIDKFAPTASNYVAPVDAQCNGRLLWDGSHSDCSCGTTEGGSSPTQSSAADLSAMHGDGEAHSEAWNDLHGYIPFEAGVQAPRAARGSNASSNEVQANRHTGSQLTGISQVERAAAAGVQASLSVAIETAEQQIARHGNSSPSGLLAGTSAETPSLTTACSSQGESALKSSAIETASVNDEVKPAEASGKGESGRKGSGKEASGKEASGKEASWKKVAWKAESEMGPSVVKGVCSPASKQAGGGGTGGEVRAGSDGKANVASGSAVPQGPHAGGGTRRGSLDESVARYASHLFATELVWARSNVRGCSASWAAPFASIVIGALGCAMPPSPAPDEVVEEVLPFASANLAVWLALRALAVAGAYDAIAAVVVRRVASALHVPWASVCQKADGFLDGALDDDSGSLELMEQSFTGWTRDALLGRGAQMDRLVLGEPSPRPTVLRQVSARSGLQQMVCASGLLSKNEGDMELSKQPLQLASCWVAAAAYFEVADWWSLSWGGVELEALSKALRQSGEVSSLPQALAVRPQWSGCYDAAKAAGTRLAAHLRDRGCGCRPVCLLGASLGARVIWHCLKLLSELPDDTGCGLVQDAVLIAAPVTANPARWERVGAVVAGRLVNVYFPNDIQLAMLYRSDHLSSKGCCGTEPVQGKRIENFDGSAHVAHLSGSYHFAVPVILDAAHII